MSLFDKDLVEKTTPKEDVIKTILDKVKDVVVRDMTHYRGDPSLIKSDIKSDLIDELYDLGIYKLVAMNVLMKSRRRIPVYHISFGLIDTIGQHDMGFDAQVSIKGIDHYSFYDL